MCVADLARMPAGELTPSPCTRTAGAPTVCSGLPGPVRAPIDVLCVSVEPCSGIVAARHQPDGQTTSRRGPDGASALGLFRLVDAVADGEAGASRRSRSRGTTFRGCRGAHQVGTPHDDHIGDVVASPMRPSGIVAIWRSYMPAMSVRRHGLAVCARTEARHRYADRCARPLDGPASVTLVRSSRWLNGSPWWARSGDSDHDVGCLDDDDDGLPHRKAEVVGSFFRDR